MGKEYSLPQMVSGKLESHMKKNEVGGSAYIIYKN